MSDVGKNTSTASRYNEGKPRAHLLPVLAHLAESVLYGNKGTEELVRIVALCRIILVPDDSSDVPVRSADAAVHIRHLAGVIIERDTRQSRYDAECRVWEMGLHKYGRYNWMRLWGEDTVWTVMDSALRHILSYQSGEVVDSESGLHHMAHVRCNMAMLIEHYERTTGAISDLILSSTTVGGDL